MPGQLVLPFAVRSALGAEDFVVSACNEAAFRFVVSWPEWPARAAALHGPEGSGKSHLARIWSERAGATVVPAAMLAPETLPADANLVVEDIDATPPSPERDRALFALFERQSGATLLTARTPPDAWPVTLADLRSRFAALLQFPVWAPDDALLGELARKLFADRQLTVPEPVIRRMLVELERTPAAISHFVARLDAASLAERRPITERLVLGLLDGPAG